jgi:hypothetical protein
MTSSKQYKKIMDHLTTKNTIPSSYLNALEERLVIISEVPSRACPSRARLSQTKKAHRDYQIKSQRKKARQVYLTVLREAPHAFLPFILVSSPKACTSFQTDSFCQTHKTDRRLQLSEAVKTDLEKIASQRNILQNCHYLEIIEQLFPRGQPSKSILRLSSADLLDYLNERQDRKSQLQMICHFTGAPLSSIELDLGGPSGWNARIELSVVESAALIAFVMARQGNVSDVMR